VGKEKKEIDDPTFEKECERKGKLPKHEGWKITVGKQECNSKDSTYFGKGMVTTEWFHAVGRTDFMIFAQGGEAVDKLLQILQGKIIGNFGSVFSTRVRQKGSFASVQMLHSNPHKVCNDLHTR
jgi:hypothetical protein